MSGAMQEHVARVHAMRHGRIAMGMKFSLIIQTELEQLHVALNEERARTGRGPLPFSEVSAVDESAAGHVDYAAKLALHLQELVTKDTAP